jgi:hypothetical protein
VCLIQSGTLGTQKKLTGTVATIAGLAAAASFTSPVTIVVGKVVRLGECLNWFQGAPARRPHAGFSSPAENQSTSNGLAPIPMLKKESQCVNFQHNQPRQPLAE